MSLWRAVSKTRKCANHVSKTLGDMHSDRSHVRVYSLRGLGFGSDVTIVVRLDEGLD